jgi:FkbM family methyltransferase
MTAFEDIRGHTIYARGLGPEAVVLDLGANRGEFCRQVQTRFGARCHAVEANPALAAALEREGRFHVWGCAVAGADGRVAFHIAGNDEASSLLALSSASVHSQGVRETLQVTSMSLTTLLARIGCPRIDLLKMDIEGAEVEVLHSVPESELRSIGQLSVEFHSHAEFGFSIHQGVDEAIRRLQRCGFLFLDFSYGTRRDVLFINRRLNPISRWREWLWRLRLDSPGLLALWHRLPSAVRRALRAPLDRATGIHRGLPPN